MRDSRAFAPVRSRQVFYFHGFDPASVKRYRRIFEASSERLGLDVEDVPETPDGWLARRRRAVTRVHHARYADQVRAFQDKGMFARLGRGIRSLVGYCLDGSGLRIARRAPRAGVLALSPVLATVLPFTITAAILRPSGPVDLAILLIIGVLLVLLARHLFLLLVADLFAFYRELAGGTSDVAEAYAARIAELSDSIPLNRTDERVIVGHSLGGIGAILAAARLLERMPTTARLSLVTLGSNHGLILLQRGAGRDRLAKAISTLAWDPRVFWLDVSSPRDAFCVPLTDPLLLIQAEKGMRSPRVISAQLANAPKIPGDRRTVFAAMRRHMAYLLPPSEDAAFDYVSTITGPKSLEEQFADRRNSPKARMWQP